MKLSKEMTELQRERSELQKRIAMQLRLEGCAYQTLCFSKTDAQAEEEYFDQFCEEMCEFRSACPLDY